MAIRPMRRYQGACHCGAARFCVETDFPELTTCDCSICRRKNALMVRVLESRFELLTGEDSLAEYRYHTGTDTRTARDTAPDKDLSGSKSDFRPPIPARKSMPDPAMPRPAIDMAPGFVDNATAAVPL